MNKSILLALISALCTVSISAQEFHIGAKAGVNLTTIDGGFESSKAKTSFHLGGLVEIPIMDALSVQPEVLYSSQGANSKFDNDDMIRLSYLTLPIMAKYYLWKTLSIEAGPQLGILLSAELEEQGQVEDFKDITKATDFGVNLGLGYKLDNGLNFGTRYYLGSNINADAASTTKIKNSVFQVSIGYFFN